MHRNLDPALHPFEKAIEYTRALNAVKLDRVFAKPFIAALPHSDGVTCLGRNPARLNSLLVGAADGTLRLWDVAAQRCLRQLVGAQPLRRLCAWPELLLNTEALQHRFVLPLDGTALPLLWSASRAPQAFDSRHSQTRRLSMSSRCTQAKALTQRLTGILAHVGHTNAVRGVSVTRNGDAAVSCSTDCTVRLWRVPYAPFESGSVEAEDRAVLQFHGNAAFKCAIQCRICAI